MDVVNGPVGIYAREKNLVLGLDPGRDKIGFAFIDLDGRLILSGIFPSGERENFFDGLSLGREVLHAYFIEGKLELLPLELIQHIKFLAIGNGTHSKEFISFVRDKIVCEILTVDERNSTLEARGLYWKIHEPKFWIKILPEGLRVPERVLDDLAACVIALRGMKKYRDINKNKL